jgi:hypothetical protein
MEEDVARLLEEHIDCMVKLDVVLFFHDHPRFLDTAEAVASWVAKDVKAVEPALRALSKAGVVERFELGSGRYVLYGYTRSGNTRDAVAGLSRVYHENEAERSAIVKRLMGVAGTHHF